MHVVDDTVQPVACICMHEWLAVRALMREPVLQPLQSAKLADSTTVTVAASHASSRGSCWVASMLESSIATFLLGTMLQGTVHMT